jgi:hypothetical protein
MAEIKVERNKGGHTWIWIVLAVVAIIAAVLLLDYAGYIDLFFQTDQTGAIGQTGAIDQTAARLAGVHIPSETLQEA